MDNYEIEMLLAGLYDERWGYSEDPTMRSPPDKAYRMRTLNVTFDDLFKVLEAYTKALKEQYEYEEWERDQQGEEKE